MVGSRGGLEDGEGEWSSRGGLEDREGEWSAVGVDYCRPLPLSIL